jgi:hypothetical protein
MAKKKPIQIDIPTLIEYWAVRQLPKTQLCNILGISPDTFDRSDLRDLYAKGREKGKAQLRGKLYDLAMKGNVSALIFALKNYAGMADRVEQTPPDEGKLLLVKQAWVPVKPSEGPAE